MKKKKKSGNGKIKGELFDCYFNYIFHPYYIVSILFFLQLLHLMFFIRT